MSLRFLLSTTHQQLKPKTNTHHQTQAQNNHHQTQSAPPSNPINIATKLTQTQRIPPPNPISTTTIPNQHPWQKPTTNPHTKTHGKPTTNPNTKIWRKPPNKPPPSIHADICRDQSYHCRRTPTNPNFAFKYFPLLHPDLIFHLVLPKKKH